jgi:hypothetical protein
MRGKIQEGEEKNIERIFPTITSFSDGTTTI